MEAEEIIERLSLKPHPEGGWFRRTYESTKQLESTNGPRPMSTSITYLLSKGEVSRLHYLDADETWYFHDGKTVELHLFENNQYRCILLGSVLERSNFQQFTIPAGTIFGARTNERTIGGWSLMSCSVCPGFILRGFDWADISILKSRFRNYSRLIDQLSA